MLTLISTDRRANEVKLDALQRCLAALDYHEMQDVAGNFYLCVHILTIRTVQGLAERDILESLVAYIQQELDSPNSVMNETGHRSLQVYLASRGLIPHAIGLKATQVSNLARDAWVRRMIEQLEVVC